MSILDWLWDLFRKPKKIKLISTTEISGDEVRALLLQFTKENLWISDETFTLVNTEDMKTFLAMNPVNSRVYFSDKHDCDDYSYELMGDVSDAHPELAFGMVWGNRVDGVAHAWNFYIDENKQVKFVEPQTDQIFDFSYEVLWVMII